MQEDFFRLPLLNENFDNIFEKDDSDISSNSIFMNTNFEEITYEEPVNIQKPNKKQLKKQSIKNTRNDDFDYSGYIQQELKKQKMDQLPEEDRRHMIQKIRNRMSAQRSRLRAKSHQDNIERENEVLRTLNNDLQNKVEFLQNENLRLKEKVEALENSKATTIPSDDEKDISELSEIFRSRAKVGSFSFNRTPMFLLLAAVCIMLFPISTSLNNSSVKIGGVIPMFGGQLPNTNKQFKTIDEMCRNYCIKNNLSCRKNRLKNEFSINKIKRVHLIDHSPKNDKQLDLFTKRNSQKLICLNPENIHEIEKIYRIIFKAKIVSRKNLNDLSHSKFHKISAM